MALEAEIAWSAPQSHREAPLLEVRDLTFRYPDEPDPVLREVNLDIYPGELVILTGPSGCGKSTLCRHFNGIIPHLSAGEILSGEIRIKGIEVAATPVHQLATLVGMVHQNPESQLVCLEVRDELAFGPENIGLTHEVIVERVEEVIDWVQLHAVAEALTFECSGGQKQRVAIGSSLALLPDLLVLDEPTTDLDPVGTESVIATIAMLRDRLGLTFMIVEHDLDALIEIADRLIVMNAGRIVYDAPPEELFNNHYKDLEEIGLRIPQHIRISRKLAEIRGEGLRFSIRRAEVRQAFINWAAEHPPATQGPVANKESQDRTVAAHPEPTIKLENVSFSYAPSKRAVDNVSGEILPGEFVALVGANGSGKSTLARLIIGLLRPQEGSINVLGMDTREHPVEDLSQRISYLFQNPDSQLFNTSVGAEVAFGMRVKAMPDEVIDQRVDDVLGLLGLAPYKERHPFALSRGERQRLALATVLVTDPDVIILDEPTTGQDRWMLDGLIRLMRRWISRKQATVLMIAHDMDLVCQHADRTIVMADGKIVIDSSTTQVFQQHYDDLQALGLRPPPVVEMSYPLAGVSLPRILLSIEDLERFFTWE